VRALNDREDSPLYDEIKLLGVGPAGGCPGAAAQELKKLFAPTSSAAADSGDMHEEAKKFFVNYFKQIAPGVRGAGTAASTASSRRRRCARSSASRRRIAGSIRSTPTRRLPRDRPVHRAWGRRIGDLAFETEGAWKRSGTTSIRYQGTEARAQYPEGAAV
jgi:hypothetical protein